MSKVIRAFSLDAENVVYIDNLEKGGRLSSRFVNDLIAEHFRTHKDPKVLLTEVKAKAEEFQAEAAKIENNLVRAEADDILRAKQDAERVGLESKTQENVAKADRVKYLRGLLYNYERIKATQPERYEGVKHQIPKIQAEIEELSR